MNKKKIINDPVYGFVSIPSALIFDLIQHPYFQRLRYIKQLGMTHLVYPGALHTRFHHALGAMHLMGLAIETLRAKGHEVTTEEEQAAYIAILLHDIGHGPFSHALEHTIVEGISHEHVSTMLMNRLNIQFGGQLSLAIGIFNKRYHKKFLSQLVSGQLDIDRMDYLNRDSFFTGVSEGVISSDRIIKMLNVVKGDLVVEEKGIYSIEKFLIARRLMYWQVYLHKTVIAGENMLIKILERAKELALTGRKLFATPNFAHFLHTPVSRNDFQNNPKHLDVFSRLDDYDIFASVKVWVHDEDFILSTLCNHLISRNLYQTEMSSDELDANRLIFLKEETRNCFSVSDEQLHYFLLTGVIENSAYKVNDGNIRVLKKDGTVQDIIKASDNANIEALSKTVTKHFVCYLKEVKNC